MRTTLYGLAFALASAALLATSASAQVPGVLNGRYQCVAHCFAPPGGFVFITQNGWEANVLNEAGQPSRAWINYRGRVWFEAVQQGAIYSPDGSTIQFDGGTLWVRAPQVLLAPPPHRYVK
ncbi:MAG TPA: hypothetical protein VH684_12150 [Xanthobacteraceae bacterium]|jgi:hypothetical protein